MNDTNNNQKIGPNGICPFMSGNPVVLPKMSRSIAAAGMQEIEVTFPQLSCVGDQCQLWDSSKGVGMCSLRVTGGAVECVSDVLQQELVPLLAELKLVLSPPQSGPSPLGRVADALEAIQRLTERKIEEGGNRQK